LTTLVLGDPLKVMEQDRGNFIKINYLDIVHERAHDMKKRLDGKIIHVVGPRKLENDLLVSFIRKETDADCLVSDFNGIERYIDNVTQKPSRLFLIDYREPRLREIFKQASLNGTGSSMARRFIVLINSRKNEDTTGQNRSDNAYGILYKCESTTVLLNWIFRLVSDGETSENGLAECIDASGEKRSTCPLTWRELQVLMLMTEGLQNSEIANQIGISSHTVCAYLYNSFKKIDARNRLKANSWVESNISILYLLI
jgi:DNA-binding NarL/FixJ family response regulator